MAPMKNMEDMIDMMDMGTTVDTIRRIITVAMTFTTKVVSTGSTESYSFLIRKTTTYVFINAKELFLLIN